MLSAAENRDSEIGHSEDSPDPKTIWSRDDWVAIGLLAAIWLVEILLVDPRGNFPLNDDWSYAAAVRTLIEHRRLELTDFTSMPLVAQILWGTLFCLPFGFSFDALRISTLTLGLLGVAATYMLVRIVAARADRRIAWLCGLVIACNPVYVCLAHSFMTDVPFFALSTLALAVSGRWIQRSNATQGIAPTILLAIASLIRQMAIAAAAAVALAISLSRPVRYRRVALGLTVIAVVWAVPAVWRQILESTTGLPALYDRPLEDLRTSVGGPPLSVVRHVILLTVISSIYVGLFLAPVVLALSPRNTAARPTPRQVRVLEAMAVLSVLTALVIAQRRMPLWGDQLNDFSVGPFFLAGTLPTAEFPATVWIPLTAISVAAAIRIGRYVAAVSAPLISRWRVRTEDDQVTMMLVSFAGLYAAPLVLGVLLDRYLLALLPALMALIVRASPGNAKRGRYRTAVGCAVLFGVFSVVATHDYLAWNRARWQAIRAATETLHVALEDLDGGREFNGWSAYRVGEHRRDPWWEPAGRTWVVSFSALPDFDLVQSFEYSRWLPGEGTVLLLRKPSR